MNESLRLGEGAGLTAEVVEEPVALLEASERVIDQAEEGAADVGALVLGRLHDGAGKEVDVVDAVVDAPQLGDGLAAHRVPQVRETGRPPDLALLAVVVVAPEAVIPAALDVERDQVHPVQSSVEEVIRYLRCSKQSCCDLY